MTAVCKIISFNTSNLNDIKRGCNFIYDEGMSDESIFARFLLKELAERFGLKNFKAKSNKLGKPLCTKSLHWSISHKNTGDKILVAAIISDKFPVAIDIEIVKERSPVLLKIFKESEYSLFQNSTNKWMRFYTLWTGKEALIKKLGLTLDDMSKILATRLSTQKISLNYNGNDYIVTIGSKDNYKLNCAEDTREDALGYIYATV